MILVAGGSGRVGGEVVRLLAGRGHPVRVLTRKAGSSNHRVAEVVVGDIRSAGTAERAVAGVQTVVSTITGFGLGDAGPAAVDDLGNRALIRAARAAGVERFVLVSIQGAGPNHPLELYRAKYRAEEELRVSGMAWTVIRPTVLMETWAMVVGEPIRAGGKGRIFGRGDNPVNFVSADDVARFVEMAALNSELEGMTLSVGGPENLTLNQVAAACLEACGRTGRVAHVPLPILRLASVLVPRFKPDIGRMIEAAVAMDTRDMTLDASRLRNRFPGVPLSTFADVAQRELVRESAPV